MNNQRRVKRGEDEKRDGKGRGTEGCAGSQEKTGGCAGNVERVGKRGDSGVGEELEKGNTLRAVRRRGESR